MNSCVLINSSFPSLKLNVFYLGALMSCYVVLEHYCDFFFFLMNQLLMCLLSYSSLPWPFSEIIERQFVESAESAVSIALIYGSQRTCSRSKVILVCGLVGSIGKKTLIIV